MLNKIRIDRKFWINLACFVLGGIFLVYLYTKYRVAPDVNLTKLGVKTPEGQTVNLSAYKGKVVFLNFWETWCGPCLKEMPTIEKARQETDSTQVVFITIAEESADKIAAFRDSHDYHFSYFISNKPFAELGINTYPTSYIIDKEGEIVLTKIGGVEWDSPEMINLIKGLCK